MSIRGLHMIRRAASALSNVVIHSSPLVNTILNVPSHIYTALTEFLPTPLIIDCVTCVCMKKMAADHPPFHVACRNMFHLANNVIVLSTHPKELRLSHGAVGVISSSIYATFSMPSHLFKQTECMYCRSMIGALCV